MTRSVCFVVALLALSSIAEALIYPFQNPRTVYVAGPLFNEYERKEMEHIAHKLEAHGFKTFLPHRDGLEFAAIFPYIVEQFKFSPEMVSQWMGAFPMKGELRN